VELTNEFRVGVPVDQAWAVLTDVERIAPCMPGAELQEIAGDEYRGIVKVKVGPITAQYKGTARFIEKDDAGHKAVLRAEGRDTRGQGNANATVTATLVGDDDGTTVRVDTDLTVTGKVAQFGRGVLADVSNKLLGQFVSCLEKDLLSSGSSAASEPPEPSGPPVSSAPESSDAPLESPPKAEEPAPEVRRIESRAAEPVDLLDAAGVPLAKRAIPLVAGVLVVLWFLRRRRRRRG
jgi:carbon monoxide dehydrogenase subunit G